MTTLRKSDKRLTPLADRVHICWVAQLISCRCWTERAPALRMHIARCGSEDDGASYTTASKQSQNSDTVDMHFNESFATRNKRSGGSPTSMICGRILICLCLDLITGGHAFGQGNEQQFRRLREDMVRTQIATDRWTGSEAVRDPRVLDSLRKTPRHRFVSAELAPYAYDDRPLPVGYGQTISQPYIVARMTELLEPKAEHRVLEIGTGSGYQAAVLSPLVANVYTIEIIEPLGNAARQRLASLGYKNIEVRLGDGYFGWPEKAPFDAIIVTAAANHIPPPLIEQLKVGGRMVIPVGNPFQPQMLVLVTKGSKGPHDLVVRSLMPVAFVPLTGGPKSK